MARATTAAAAATAPSALARFDLAVGDLVEYKTGLNRPWRSGWVAGIDPHAVRIKDAATHVTMTIAPGKKGRIKRTASAGLASSIAVIRAATARNAVASPEGLRYYLGSTPPRPMYRSEEYLVWVQTWPCVGCGAAAPCEAHHAGPHGVGQKCDDFQTVPLCHACHRDVTTHYTVPGWTREEFEVRQLRAMAALLTEWAQRMEVQR